MRKSSVSMAVVMLIIGIVSLVIVIGAIVAISYEPDKDPVYLCRSSNMIRDKTQVEDFSLLSLSAVEFDVNLQTERTCTFEPFVIYADDWDKCDEEIKEAYDEASTANKPYEVKRCLSQQVAELIAKCWYMYGEGEWDVGSGVCSYGIVQVLDSKNANFGGISEGRYLIERFTEYDVFGKDYTQYIENVESSSKEGWGDYDEIDFKNESGDREVVMANGQWFFVNYCDKNYDYFNMDFILGLFEKEGVADFSCDAIDGDCAYWGCSAVEWTACVAAATVVFKDPLACLAMRDLCNLYEDILEYGDDKQDPAEEFEDSRGTGLPDVRFCDGSSDLKSPSKYIEVASVNF